MQIGNSPYELNTINNEECLQAMKKLPDKYFELAIVDPPYGIGMDKTTLSNRASNSKKFKNYKGKQYIGEWIDNKPAPKEYFKELFRISKNQIIWGANHFIEQFNKNSSCWIVWYKNGQCPTSTNADCELAWASFKTAVKYFRYDWSGFGAVNSKENKIHPTQKPVALYEWLLNNYAKKGDKILDTHLGSASSIIACKKLGFEYLGFELDPDYFKSASERIAKFEAQGNMFSILNEQLKAKQINLFNSNPKE